MKAMKRVGKTLIFLCVFIGSALFGQKNQQVIGGAEINSITSDDFSDLRWMDSLVQGKRLVFLGESQHGVNDFNLIKFRLIRYLHQHHGFDVVAFESGAGPCGITNLMKDSLSGMRMLVHSLLGIWRVKGNCELMNYLKIHQLDLAGLDPNDGALFFNKDQLNLILKDRELSRQLAELDSLNYYHFLLPKSKTYFGQEIIKETLLDSVAKALEVKYKILKEKIMNLPNLNEFEKRTFQMAFDAKFLCLSVSNDRKNPRFFISFAERDQFMAKKLEYLMDTLYPHRKIIVWAHNAHISKIADNKKVNKGASLGSFLPEKIRKQSFIIGIYATSGQYALGMAPCNSIKYPNSNLERVYAGFHSKAMFLDSKKIGDKRYFQGLPHYYKINVSKAYDGIILIKEVECSKLLKYNKDFVCE
jgi:erythromycin esterase